MRRTLMVAVVCGVALGGMAVGGAVRVQPAAADRDLAVRVLRLEDRAAQLGERVARVETSLQRIDTTVSTLTKQVRTLVEFQDRLRSAIALEPGGVRITGTLRVDGNVRLDGNTLDDTTTVDCDKESGQQRRCTCPDGRVAIGIELRPLSVSAMPGPSTYNTVLVCSRL